MNGHGCVARHEAAYAQWLTENPIGFVLLERTLTIHRSTCRSVRPLRSPSLLGGGVWCDPSIAALEYALLQIEGAVYRCTRCRPQSDPEGVGMRAEYAAKMRAHLAKQRAL